MGLTDPGAGPVGRWHHVVVDCADPEALAAFWSAALAVGVEGRWHQYVMLEPTVPGGPALAFQQVPEPKAGKNRLHLDLMVDDLAGAADRIVALGGTGVSEVTEDGVTVRVFADPEGNELCLVHIAS